MDTNNEDIATQETENDDIAGDDDKDATGADKGDKEDQGDPGPPDSVAVQGSIAVNLDQLSLLRRRQLYGNISFNRSFIATITMFVPLIDKPF